MNVAFSYVFAFVLLLSVLVFVHELGHFLVARACGVRVLKFSIGFGHPIGFGRWRMRWKRGGTEYVVAWFPLGGFVKMLGENPDEIDDPDVAASPDEALPNKPTWQKLAIVFAGPVANLLLPVLLFAGTLAVGFDRPASVVGSVEPSSPAAEAGLRAGDRVTAVGGEPVHWWGDLEAELRERAGERVSLAYERGGERGVLELDLATRASLDEFGQAVDVGWSGAHHPRLAPILGVASSDTPAHAAGLRSGERVTAVDGAEVEDWTGFAAAYAAAGRGGEVELALAQGEGDEAVERTLRVPALGSVDALGVRPASVLIVSVSDDSAASDAGLRPGDLIVAVDGQPVGSFVSFAEMIRTSDGRPLEVRYARGVETHEVTLAPRLQEVDAGFGIKEPRYLIGVTSQMTSVEGALELDRERNPIVAVPRAVDMTVSYTVSLIKGFGKFFTGEVDTKQIAGPIGIAELAGNAFQRGWETYLSMMVLISINLGILNLLPIPVLDGGQAVIFAVEGIRRAPLSLRTREIVQQVGLTVLLLLMGLAFWNDLSRQWTRFVDWLGGA